MSNPNVLLAAIEQKGLWSIFHKDWLIEIRRALRPQLPAAYAVFVESETILLSPDWEQPPPKTMPDLGVARPVGDLRADSTQAHAATAPFIELDEPYEISTQYSLILRRSSDQEIIGALEMLSPSNKSVSSRIDREKYLHKRDSYMEIGVSFLEIDALLRGERVLPESLHRLSNFPRNAWTSFHRNGNRRLRGYGWNERDNLPVVSWQIEADLGVLVDLNATCLSALDFNPWESLVRGPGSE